MTPKEFCEYIVEGEIFKDRPSFNSDYSELGSAIWPARYDKLRALAKEALESNDQSD